MKIAFNPHRRSVAVVPLWMGALFAAFVSSGVFRGAAAARLDAEREPDVVASAMPAKSVPAPSPSERQPASRTRWRFDFGAGAVAPGCIAVRGAEVYEAARGWGFEPGAAVRACAVDDRGDPLASDALAADAPFFFTVDVPEGNYRVTVTLGAGKSGAACTTVKAELRRLMLETVDVPAGTAVVKSFLVNVRTPRIAAANGVAAGAVRLKAPRETTDEAWAWDSRLTLEFNGAQPTVCGLEITPASDDVATLFLLGDSTVCDQGREPYASWGQMLPRFLVHGVSIANHGESGETYRDALARRRLDKILGALRPGDLVLLQFGHNDQKQIKAGSGGPFTTYMDEMRRCVAAVRERGARPVLVTSMERRAFDAAGNVVASLRDYAEAVRRVAAEQSVPCLDLNASSRTLYKALGEEGSKAAFAVQQDRIDNTHHNPYGAYLLAQAIAQMLLERDLIPAAWRAVDFAGFDPRRPLAASAFRVPPSPAVTQLRPLGD